MIYSFEFMIDRDCGFSAVLGISEVAAKGQLIIFLPGLGQLYPFLKFGLN